MTDEEKEGYHMCVGCREWVSEDHLECREQRRDTRNQQERDYDNFVDPLGFYQNKNFDLD